MGLEGIFDEVASAEKEAPKKEEPKREEIKKEETPRKAKALSFDEIVEKILTTKPGDHDQLMALIKSKQEELSGFVTVEGAAMLVAKTLGVDLEKKPEEKPIEKPPEEKPAKVPSPLAKKEPAVEGAELELAEAKGTAKSTLMDYGLKGSGKTYLAFSFPGKIACLSFDKKSLPIKQYSFNNDERIRVFDAIALMDYSSPEAWTESADKSFKRLNILIDKIAEWEPDWIVIDGSEILQQICEMTMRYRNNLMAFQGIANRNIWKERRMYIRQIHNKCFEAAKKGVIYTTYTSKDEIIKEGEFVTKDDVPKWVDCILWETDVVIKIRSVQEKSGRKFYATIESSKHPPFITGKEVDITNKGVGALIEERA